MYRFKEIQTVLQAKDLVDVVLSRTQRKTPTEVHPQFNINRIRSFYMRKVKYAQATFEEKLTKVVDDFPKIDDLHPFYADLCNVLYDRDHYKLALGQVKTVLGTIQNIAKDYNKLLKFADSLYKCKMLKRAGLGRMCTAIKKLQASLQYLEEVRQHMSRLPQINPSSRTIIVTGYPNVGKSSFVNLVSQANVDVQPYAFTTKSVFVGHFDFKYTRWQILDTPGILDHPLEERNTIEMTAITALAHIPATVMFFLDISETCGYSIEQQVALFHSIKPLFKQKPLLVVLNKIDARPLELLDANQKALIESMKIDEKVSILPTSCLAAQGIDDVKNLACELLLSERVNTKIEQHKTDQIQSRIYITQVTPTGSRPPCIPESVLAKRSGDLIVSEERVTEKEKQEQSGGAGVYSTDLRKEWSLKDDSWRHDALPEIMDGMNVLDWIDPEIDKRLEELEREEEALMWGDDADEAEAKQYKEVQKTLAVVHSKMEQQRLENRLRRNLSRHAIVRGKNKQKVGEVEEHLALLGVEEVNLSHRGKKRVRQDEDEAVNDVEMDGAEDNGKKRKIRRTTHRTFHSEVSRGGLTRPSDQVAAELNKRRKTKQLNKLGHKGEADRVIPNERPKHLFSGKRGIGKTDRR